MVLQNDRPATHRSAASPPCEMCEIGLLWSEGKQSPFSPHEDDIRADRTRSFPQLADAVQRGRLQRRYLREGRGIARRVAGRKPAAASLADRTGRAAQIAASRRLIGKR